MILREWIPPTHRFCYIDDLGKPREHICHGPEDDLRKRLDAKGIKVEWVREEPFSRWQRRAAKATREVVRQHKAGEPIRFSQKIWQDLKWHLFELFDGKCAYCESRVQHIERGCVEHYRPKGGVDEDLGHPGYFWLAYCYKNLLPSCTLCNEEPGKTTHFPVEGSRSRHYHSWAREQSLLLNPYELKINPFEHLEFNSVGRVEPRNDSALGRESEKWYRLNRFGLGTARQSASKQVHRDLCAGILQKNAFEAAYDDLESKIILGDREYSAAQRWELYRIGKGVNTHLTNKPEL